MERNVSPKIPIGALPSVLSRPDLHGACIDDGPDSTTQQLLTAILLHKTLQDPPPSLHPQILDKDETKSSLTMTEITPRAVHALNTTVQAAVAPLDAAEQVPSAWDRFKRSSRLLRSESVGGGWEGSHHLQV